MTKSNKRGGRPTAYREEYNRIARRMALLGATDADIANALGVSEQTLNTWKRKHSVFLEALKSGKAEADATVASRLYERATGYSHAEEKVFVHDGEVIRAETTRHYPPDTTAAIFWLKNRQPAQWRDKHQVNHGVSDGLSELMREIDGQSRGIPSARRDDNEDRQ